MKYARIVTGLDMESPIAILREEAKKAKHHGR
jgi:hypothetical protein